jgi:hypothetical protein
MHDLINNLQSCSSIGNNTSNNSNNPYRIFIYLARYAFCTPIYKKYCLILPSSPPSFFQAGRMSSYVSSSSSSSIVCEIMSCKKRKYSEVKSWDIKQPPKLCKHTCVYPLLAYENLDTHSLSLSHDRTCDRLSQIGHKAEKS